jgi:hypothetical protein
MLDRSSFWSATARKSHNSRKSAVQLPLRNNVIVHLMRIRESVKGSCTKRSWVELGLNWIGKASNRRHECGIRTLLMNDSQRSDNPWLGKYYSTHARCLRCRSCDRNSFGPWQLNGFKRKPARLVVDWRIDTVKWLHWRHGGQRSSRPDGIRIMELDSKCKLLLKG